MDYYKYSRLKRRLAYYLSDMEAIKIELLDLYDKVIRKIIKPRYPRKLQKSEHPFIEDGFWYWWVGPNGDWWTLRTLCWTGKQPKEFRKFGIALKKLIEDYEPLPSYYTKEYVQDFVRASNSGLVCPYVRYFFHPIREQAVCLTNERKCNEWLNEKFPDRKKNW